jgi:hypothetical protein
MRVVALALFCVFGSACTQSLQTRGGSSEDVALDALASMLLGLNIQKSDITSQRPHDFSRRSVLQHTGSAFMIGLPSVAHAVQIQPVSTNLLPRTDTGLTQVSLYEGGKLEQAIKDLKTAVEQKPAGKAVVDLYVDAIKAWFDKPVDFEKIAGDAFWKDRLAALESDKSVKDSVSKKVKKIQELSKTKDIEQMVVQILAVGEDVESWAYAQR